MRTKRVVVEPYDASWESSFESIRSEIETAVGDLIIGVEHVGSTSVAGMSAKPCIDLDVVIRDYSVFDAVVEKLRRILLRPKVIQEPIPTIMIEGTPIL